MNSAPEPNQLHPPAAKPVVRPVLRGHRSICFVSAAVAIAGAFFLFDSLLLTRRWLVTDSVNLLVLGGTLLRGLGLSAVAWQMFRYASAVRNYGVTGEEALNRLEVTHSSLWHWCAGFMALYLLFGLVLVVSII